MLGATNISLKPLNHQRSFGQLNVAHGKNLPKESASNVTLMVTDINVLKWAFIPQKHFQKSKYIFKQCKVYVI